MWTYEIYESKDTSNELKNKVRQNFNFEGKDAYFLLNNGRIDLVQWEGQYPTEYGSTLEEAAINHCAALNGQVTEPDADEMEAALNELGIETRSE